MAKNTDFALLVGRAFLHENNEEGHRDSAIAFGRAFLIALGMRGPEDAQRDHALNGIHGNHPLATAEN
jgi:hypothetical protein